MRQTTGEKQTLLAHAKSYRMISGSELMMIGAEDNLEVVFYVLNPT